jgi:hypothetical protein
MSRVDAPSLPVTGLLEDAADSTLTASASPPLAALIPISINGALYEAVAETRLIDAINRAGVQLSQVF